MRIYIWVKYEHHLYMCYNEIAKMCLDYISLYMWTLMKAIGRVYVIVEERKYHHLDNLLQYLHLNANFEIWNSIFVICNC